MLPGRLLYETCSWGRQCPWTRGLPAPASTRTGAEHPSRILRPRFTACRVNALAHAARTKEGESAMPALAEPMTIALEKRFPTTATFVERRAFAASSQSNNPTTKNRLTKGYSPLKASGAGASLNPEVIESRLRGGYGDSGMKQLLLLFNYRTNHKVMASSRQSLFHFNYCLAHHRVLGCLNNQ